MALGCGPLPSYRLSYSPQPALRRWPSIAYPGYYCRFTAFRIKCSTSFSHNPAPHTTLSHSAVLEATGISAFYEVNNKDFFSSLDNAVQLTNCRRLPSGGTSHHSDMGIFYSIYENLATPSSRTTPYSPYCLFCDLLFIIQFFKFCWNILIVTKICELLGLLFLSQTSDSFISQTALSLIDYWMDLLGPLGANFPFLLFCATLARFKSALA